MKLSVILVAGGSGLRMGADVPKQFLIIGGKPVLMHTIEAFDGAFECIVVLPADHIGYWKQLCVEYGFAVPHQIVEGGAERFYSVRNGLGRVSVEADFVAVHDGVRPWVSRHVIENALQVATECGAAVPVVAVTDSIRIVEGDSLESRPLDRRLLRAVQTPQVFRRAVLQQSYTQPFSAVFTDDASVVEAAGFRVGLSEGEYANRKITTPEDLDS